MDRIREASAGIAKASGERKYQVSLQRLSLYGSNRKLSVLNPSKNKTMK